MTCGGDVPYIPLSMRNEEKIQMLKTRMTDLFEIKHPIMLAGMNWITDTNLVAAVSNAGGLGIFATARCTPDEMRESIREIRKLTNKPFGVNVILRPGSEAKIKVAVEEKVPILNYTLGKPWFIDRVHAYGGKVLGTTAVAKHAAKAAQLGCDAVVVTGHEAAAHGDKATTMVLTPIAAATLKVPVISAGGIYDGRGLAAVLALGADGVSMGTRFMLTAECVLHDNFKNLCLAATEQDTVYDTAFDGLWGRVLKTRGAEDIQKGGYGLFERLQGAMKIRKVLKLSYPAFIAMGIKTMMAGDDGASLWKQSRQAVGAVRSMKAIYEGNTESGFLFAGQNIGGISDVPTVKELIERTVAEAEQVIDALQKKRVA
ncbi:MAG: nitronate monooxygenase [Syntrophales bacterium]|nr:nitronate monooxygenase [Syntrophales bacterium]